MSIRGCEVPAGGHPTAGMRPSGRSGSRSLHIRNARHSLRWGQILQDVKPVRTLQPTGALLAGYDANVLMLPGISPLVRPGSLPGWRP